MLLYVLLIVLPKFGEMETECWEGVCDFFFKDFNPDFENWTF